MRVCVVKGTVKVISNGLNTDEIFYADALSSGFGLEEVEILTQEDFDDRKASEPQPVQQSTLEDYVLELEFRLLMLELGLQ